MRPILSASILLASLAGGAFTQPVAAPTPETVGSARGKNIDDYNIINSFETGYRFADIHGNREKYRSDENFRNGLRLLGSSFAINSKDGHGRLFDEILLNTQGPGDDPYEVANLPNQQHRVDAY